MDSSVFSAKPVQTECFFPSSLMLVKDALLLDSSSPSVSHTLALDDWLVSGPGEKSKKSQAKVKLDPFLFVISLQTLWPEQKPLATTNPADCCRGSQPPSSQYSSVLLCSSSVLRGSSSVLLGSSPRFFLSEKSQNWHFHRLFQKNPNPPLKRDILWAWEFSSRKKPKISGAHQIRAAISGPTIARGKIRDMRLFLILGSPPLHWVTFVEE